jgi:uncharacterized membrane protein YphA (DoxX/SURF4 family)
MSERAIRSGCRLAGEVTSLPLSGVLLVLRIGLGGLFLFAAYQKLFASPFSHQNFMEAILAFRVIPNRSEWDWLLMTGTYGIPWIELLAGLALVLGVWTRAAALVIGVLLMVFIAGIVSVVTRGFDVDCSCFGQYKLLCGNKALPEALAVLREAPPVGWCKVGEDALMALAAAALWTWGGGRLALDATLCHPLAGRGAGA